MFYDAKDEHVIMLHKPHPGNIVKKYVIREIINNLKRKGKI